MHGSSPILLVEDDPNDVRLFQAALVANRVRNPVWAVEDGQQAIDYLRGEGVYADRKRYHLPEFIVTDLKMPRVSGLEFIQWLRTASSSPMLPVVVLSASNLEADVRAAYRLGANGYVRKPSTFDELQRIVATLVQYWNNCEKPLPEMDSVVV
jgi:CheY-like chemotaxis protein